MRRAHARIVVFLRWLLVPAWVAGAIAATLELPPLSEQAEVLQQVVPADAQAILAERAEAREFGFPLIARTALVQHDPRGLSPRQQRAVAAQAAELTTTDLGPDAVRAAVPVLDTGPLAPGRSGPPTTAVTFLLIAPGSGEDALDLGEQTADAVARAHPELPAPMVTGTGPAETASANLALDRLWLLEIVTAALVSLVVALYFRSLVAPLVTLAAVVVSYAVGVRVIALLAEEGVLRVSDQAQPVIVALVFGVVTDYSIFFLGRMRQRVRAGAPPRDAARDATRDVSGVVTVAALTIAVASTALLAAELEFFEMFGPAMAVAVGVAWLVVTTLTPALMAIFGRRLFWPSAVAAPDHQAQDGDGVPSGARRVLAFATRFRVVTVVACLAVLGAAASGLRFIEIYNPSLLGLPADSGILEGQDIVEDAYPAGLLSPLSVTVHGAAAQDAADRLERLQAALERRPGVAAVIGPGSLDAELPRGVFVSRAGDVARLLVVPRGPPMSPEAIALARDLGGDVAGLLDGAGIRGGRALIAGDAAIAAQTIDRLFDDLLLRIAPLVLLALFVILALYLRAVVAALFLVAASVAALLAALGLTVYVFQFGFDVEGVGFFVPVTVSVLLVALGSDYNVFLAGRIWDEAGDRPWRDTIVRTGARAASSISIAGIVLALSFGAMAIVPTTRFREAAFAMSAGLLIDAFLVRSLLVPAVLALLGPGRRRGRVGSPPPGQAPTQAP